MCWRVVETLLIANDEIPRTGGAWQVVTDGGKYSNAVRRQPMKKELELLCNYLKKNGYEDDSKRVEEIMHDITKADSENAKKRLIAMCNPRYLGNLNIEEFDNVYEWWNFLADISSKAKSEDI